MTGKQDKAGTLTVSPSLARFINLETVWTALSQLPTESRLDLQLCRGIDKRALLSMLGVSGK